MNQQLQHVHVYCPDGQKHNRIEDPDAGEQLCSKCGMVFEERTIYDEHFSHTSTKKKDDNEYKGQSNKHLGESTFIPKKMVDVNGKAIDFKNRGLFKQINKWDSIVKWNANRGPMLSQLKQCCDTLLIHETTQVEIIKYMNKVIDEKLTRGRVVRQMIASVIYYVCKQYDIPKTMSEISKEMNVPTKIIYQNLRVLNEAFGSVAKVQSMQSYVSKYFTKTEISPKHEKDVLRLLLELEKTQFHVGKQPATVIGGVMKYVVTQPGCDYKGTFGDLAKACGISEVSLRNSYDKIIPILGV